MKHTQQYIITDEQMQDLYSMIYIPYEQRAVEIFQEVHTHPYQSEHEVWFPTSSDLLLIANDEWKRREERRHIHETIPWVHGWINGFMTSRKFAKEQLEKIHKQANRRQDEHD